MSLSALGSCVGYRVCQIMFLIAQALTWYIQASYVLVTVRTSNVYKDNEAASWWVRVVNLSLHILLTVLLHWSHWRVACSDPGWVDSEYECTKLAEENGITKWEIKSKYLPAAVKNEMPRSSNSADLESGASEPLLNAADDATTSASDNGTLLTTGRQIVQVPSNNRSFSGFRYCATCDSLKPPRAHHCGVCGKCVMRMDHHCPWMGNCVGLRTHKYFICFLFWCVLSCVHVAISSQFIATPDENVAGSRYIRVNDYIILNGETAQVMCIGVSISVCIMLCMHHTLIVRNESTLEFAELNLMQGGNPYDVGGDRNYKQIMGPQWWQYLLPFHIGPVVFGKKNGNYLDGINYPRRPAPERQQPQSQPADEAQPSQQLEQSTAVDLEA